MTKVVKPYIRRGWPNTFGNIVYPYLDRGRILAVYGSVRELSEFIKNILICVPKMNEGLTGLEWHEGE